MSTRVVNRTLTRWALLFALAPIYVLLASCGGGGGGTAAAPSITSQPESVTVASGQSVSFSVSATGSGTLSYQWAKNSSAIAGATSATFTLSAVSTADNGAIFTVTVGDSAGSTSSSGATLTVAFAAQSGVAQKGPLIQGSTVTAQELDANLSPTGKQYSYQTNSNLGTFDPTSTFTSQYIGTNATGYYYDEVANAVSDGTTTLNGYTDLSSASVLNVNLLTTLAYQRIQSLVTKSGMTFAAAQAQAESEVLAAFHINNAAAYGDFSTFDLSKGIDGDHILAAISSIFVYGNTAGNLSTLIANVQSDIGVNGAITNSATLAALAAAAQAVNPAVIAVNLTQEYSSLGVQFSAGDISDWLDVDGDGLTGRFKFNSVRAPQASPLALPLFVTDPYAGTQLAVTAGQISVNGTPVTAPVVTNAGDIVSVSPPSDFSDGELTVYLFSGATKIGRVSFYGHGAWSPAAQMITQRGGYAGPVLLPNGKVVVVGGCTPQGGCDIPLSSAEIYDPTTDKWSAAASLPNARVGATATLLTSGPNAGSVLVVGGEETAAGSSNLTASLSAELYNPVTNSWSAAGNISTARESFTATVLGNGNVLLVGGVSPNSSVPTASCELYNAATNTWTTAESLPVAVYAHRAVLLENGDVLVATGWAGTAPAGAAELYNPTLGTWSAAGTLITPRDQSTATLLANGNVLVAGGADQEGLASTELYNPAANTWTSGASLLAGLADPAAVALGDGTVLLIGNTFGTSFTWGPEVYDPVADSWSSAAGSYSPPITSAQQLILDPTAALQFADGIVFAFNGTENLLYWQ